MGIDLSTTSGAYRVENWRIESLRRLLEDSEELLTSPLAFSARKPSTWNLKRWCLSLRRQCDSLTEMSLACLPSLQSTRSPERTRPGLRKKQHTNRTHVLFLSHACLYIYYNIYIMTVNSSYTSPGYFMGYLALE